MESGGSHADGCSDLPWRKNLLMSYEECSQLTASSLAPPRSTTALSEPRPRSSWHLPARDRAWLEYQGLAISMMRTQQTQVKRVFCCFNDREQSMLRSPTEESCWENAADYGREKPCRWREGGP